MAVRIPTSVTISGDLREYTFRTFEIPAPEKSDRVREYDKESVNRARSMIRRITASTMGRQIKGRRTNGKFISFTYAREEQDRGQANRDWANFMRKVKASRWWDQDCGVIATFEIQWERAEKYGVKVWHIHAIFIGLNWSGKDYSELIEMWGHGSVVAKHVYEGVKNAGYLAKYIGEDAKAGSGTRQYICCGKVGRPITISDRFREIYDMHEYDLEHSDCIKKFTVKRGSCVVDCEWYTDRGKS